jgi:hypothetical protein
MQSNQPPSPRRIEIVPLDDRTAPGRPLPSAAARLLPAWPPPSVRTTVHPSPRVTLPTDVVIDLTSLVPSTGEVHVDLTAADAAPEPAAAAEQALVGARRDRLRALLASERAELERTVGVVALRPPALAEVAPFPLPPPAVDRAGPLPSTAPVTAPVSDADTDPGTALRRVPKAVRPDAEVRPLSGDVAAAIHRLTGRDLPTVPRPSVARRIEIVPLDDPTPLAPVVHLTAPRSPSVPAAAAATGDEPSPAAPAEIDLRGGPSAALTCPACRATGQLDVVDHITHTAHFSCGICFRMWSERLGDDR